MDWRYETASIWLVLSYEEVNCIWFNLTPEGYLDTLLTFRLILALPTWSPPKFSISPSKTSPRTSKSVTGLCGCEEKGEGRSWTPVHIGAKEWFNRSHSEYDHPMTPSQLRLWEHRCKVANPLIFPKKPKLGIQMGILIFKTLAQFFKTLHMPKKTSVGPAPSTQLPVYILFCCILKTQLPE